MKQDCRLLVSFATLLLCVTTVEARNGSQALRYRGGDAGPVLFSHALHAAKGIRCNDCHANLKGTEKQLFVTQKQGLIGLEDHRTETKCFACHSDRGIPAKEVQGVLYGWSTAPYSCDCCHYSDAAVRLAKATATEHGVPRAEGDEPLSIVKVLAILLAIAVVWAALVMVIGKFTPK